MLPKIETPIHEFTVPSTGEVKRFRPFLVKEEKILMLASEGGEYGDMVSACEQVVSNCSQEELDVANLSIFDLQHLFIRLKEKSTGTTQEFQLICGGCEDRINYTLQLADVQVTGLEEAGSNIVKIGDEVAIELKYPTARVIAGVTDGDDTSIVASCISKVFEGEETIDIKDEKPEDVVEFIDNLPLDTFQEVQEFFNRMPRVEHVVEYKCHNEECGFSNRISINGYEHFFG
jgi:hypothetical protein